jgi:two-component system, OmpR family, sensor kinase
VTVRARFALTVAAVVAITVALYATVSIVAIDGSLRSGFTARLTTTAQAMTAAVDVHHGVVSVDAGDLAQLAALRHGTAFAIIGTTGSQIAGDPLSARPSTGVRSIDIAVVRAGKTYGSIVVWEPDAWITDVDRIAALVSVAIGLVLLSVGALVSQRVARTALAPLESIASLAERIEGHDLTSRLHADGRDELGRLCASFDRMLDRLQGAFERERRLLADGSHELRAPLAVLRAETELALRRTRSEAEYRAALQSIAHESGRLEGLVDGLLAAARAEVDAGERQMLDAGGLALDIGERVRPAAELRGVGMRVDAPPETFAAANRATLERALLAIVHNAIGHARDGGVVELSVARTGEAICIVVGDDGPGFSQAALEHATERFWRDDSARPRGGTGLGLAIARTMVEANGGTLQLTNRPGGGAQVVVSLATFA